MQYLIIEHFKPGRVKDLYERFDQKGRMMPEGLRYINSWISSDVSTCYQVMETDNQLLLQEWISCWNDIVDFEVIPVISSAEARAKVMSS